MIRCATKADCAAMRDIYLPYVRDTAITFEETLPTEETFLKKLEALMPKYPFYVYEKDGEIAAYAYASAFRERAAYRWGAELSVYVDKKYQGQGIGHGLYAALLETLTRQGYKTAYGVVTLPNEISARLHASFGFTQSALLKNAGYKMKKWHDVAIFEKPLGAYEREVAETKPLTVG